MEWWWHIYIILTQLGAGSRRWSRCGIPWWGRTTGSVSAPCYQHRSRTRSFAPSKVPQWCCPETRNQIRCELDRLMTSASHKWKMNDQCLGSFKMPSIIGINMSRSGPLCRSWPMQSGINYVWLLCWSRS